jgi:peptide deformylase
LFEIQYTESVKTLAIVQLGDPVLRKVGKKLSRAEIASPEMQKLMDVMVASMHKADGIGLAAPQIGKSLQLAIVSHADGDLIICNPKITKRSFRKEELEEGCLSIRGVFGEVRRNRSVRVEFLDRLGEKRVMDAEGLLARIFQHEIDHLNGKVYADRTKKFTAGALPQE